MQVSSKFSSLLFSAIVLSISAYAGVTENFNSRKGVPVNRVRSTLQNSCWTFHHFDVNLNGWNPNIEGDGAMVASTDAIHHAIAGIVTPLLSVTSDIDVSFEYVFNKNFDASSTRWIKICLANANNEVVKVLETVRFVGVNAVKTRKFATTYSNIPAGEYRLLLQYGGSGGDAALAIDELGTSAPFTFDGGCSGVPVAVRNNINGNADRTASGSLLMNDRDGDKNSLTAYLIKSSPDGSVELNENGNFTFTPNKHFSGASTSFVYKVCNASNLCSPNATVVIKFPSSGLTDFKGSYRYDGNVEIAWNTQAGSGISKFELERSVDGRKWQHTAIVFAANESVQKPEYTYIDKVGKNTALKKDIYYRLKQINQNGSVFTSRLMIVRVLNTPTVSMISVTPNPAKSDIAVNLQLQAKSLVSMRIINASGTTVMHQKAKVQQGISNILIEGSSTLAPGFYNLEVVVNSKEKMSVKLIKE